MKDRHIYRAWIELALNSAFCATDYECMKQTPSEETDVVAQVVKKIPAFEGTQSSVPRLQEHASFRRAEPDESSSSHSTSFI